MTSPCSNPELEQKLHAYELGMLSDADREMVEVHLVECESCYSEIKELNKAAALLRDDETIRNVALSLESENAESSNGVAWFEKILQSTWLRSSYSRILPLAIVLLLVSVVLFQLLPERDQQEEIQQTLDLFPMRGSKPNVLIKNESRNAVINFVYKGAEPGKVYLLRITSIGGAVVFTDDRYVDFDATGQGSIVVPLDKFSEGVYEFNIIDPTGEPPDIRQEYFFKVEDAEAE